MIETFAGWTIIVLLFSILAIFALLAVDMMFSDFTGRGTNSGGPGAKSKRCDCDCCNPGRNWRGGPR